jgi:hypothetical protein
MSHREQVECLAGLAAWQWPRVRLPPAPDVLRTEFGQLQPHRRTRQRCSTAAASLIKVTRLAKACSSLLLPSPQARGHLRRWRACARCGADPPSRLPTDSQPKCYGTASPILSRKRSRTRTFLTGIFRATRLIVSRSRRTKTSAIAA